MCMLDEIQARRDEIYAVARAHKAEKLWVFGSCARKEETPEADRRHIHIAEIEKFRRVYSSA